MLVGAVKIVWEKTREYSRAALGRDDAEEAVPGYLLVWRDDLIWADGGDHNAGGGERRAQRRQKGK